MIHRLAVAAIVSLAWAGAQAAPRVGYTQLDGTVNPGTADHLVRVIAEANEQGLDAVLIRIDTPGGMVDSTRVIVKAMLASQVPVIVWVGPAGARAGSAGVFLTMAADVAAMAPATNIGAAHPVAMGGEQPDDTMKEKLTNDLAAWARGIAAQRGRNEDWAARAVTESASVPAELAVKEGVVDLVAADPEAVLLGADGLTIVRGDESKPLQLSGATLLPMAPTPRERVLGALGDPNLAMLLLGIGFLLLMLELYSPGLIVPGVAGVVLLSLGLVATRMIPLNAGALLLVVVGAGLIVAELFAPTMGLLGVAGGVSIALGAFFLVDPTNPDFLVDRTFGIGWSMVLPTLVVIGVFVAMVAWKLRQARRLPQTTGAGGLIGEQGVTASDVDAHAGSVLVHGELWESRSNEPIPAGRPVRVQRIEGLVLGVRPATVEERRPS